MDWNAFATGGGGKAVTGFLSNYLDAKEKNRIAKIQNEALKRATAWNIGIISQNKAQARAEKVGASISAQTAHAKAQGSAKVSAAFAGTAGGSVDAQSMDLARSLAGHENVLSDRLEADLNSQNLQVRDQLLNQHAGLKSVSSPTFLDLALGIGAGMIEDRVSEVGSDGTAEGGAEQSNRTIFNFL